MSQKLTSIRSKITCKNGGYRLPAPYIKKQKRLNYPHGTDIIGRYI